MMNQSRAVAYWTLGRSDLLSMDMAERVRTAVTPECGDKLFIWKLFFSRGGSETDPGDNVIYKVVYKATHSLFC